MGPAKRSTPDRAQALEISRGGGGGGTHRARDDGHKGGMGLGVDERGGRGRRGVGGGVCVCMFVRINE